MLPSPNLDDRTFQQIVHEARKAIPKWMPEWTDENVHDPGITFIELFSWLTEMQQYYMNRVPDANLRKFLKLLGLKPEHERSAQVDVQFEHVTHPVYLPQGTKLLAQDQPFETEAGITLTPARLSRVLVRTEKEANDYTSTNDNVGVSFFAFGQDAAAGSRLYLALNQEMQPGEEWTLAVRLQDTAHVPGMSYEELQAMVTPSARVSWKFYGSMEGQGSSGWYPLEVLSDHTLHLTYSGKIHLRLPGRMRPVMVHPANDQGRYWICCTIEEPGYERAPRIELLALNAVRAIQRDTRSQTVLYASNGEPGYTLHWQSYLACYGEVRVQVLQSDGSWRYWREVRTFDGCTPHDEVYTLRVDELQAAATITFGDGTKGTLPPPGDHVIRLIAFVPEFRYARWIGRSSGLPNQRLPVYELPLQSGRFQLQIGVAQQGSGRQELYWQDWEEVDGFDTSGPCDLHYCFDSQTGELRFGDGERGAIPPSHSDSNMCLIGCEFGGGERGNVKPHLITTFVDERQRALGLKVVNPFFATGGTARESLEDCITRARFELEQPFRAVTTSDVEQLARQTPGLRVAAAKALPDFAKPHPHASGEPAKGHLTVVVVPYSDAETPMPSDGFMQTVQRFLNERRLITTELHVIAPAYIRVTVHAVVAVEPYFVQEHAQVERALHRLLQPLDRENKTAGWPFGRPLYRGDLLSVISAIKGVAFVQELHMEAEGLHWHKTAGGDLVIPPYGLLYSGIHDIELVSRTHV